jgi:hypothetical protein
MATGPDGTSGACTTEVTAGRISMAAQVNAVAPLEVNPSVVAPGVPVRATARPVTPKWPELESGTVSYVAVLATGVMVFCLLPEPDATNTREPAAVVVMEPEFAVDDEPWMPAGAAPGWVGLALRSTRTVTWTEPAFTFEFTTLTVMDPGDAA